MKTYLMSIAGVLRKTVGGAIIPDGVSLYSGLATVGQVVLLAEDGDEVRDWLELNGLIRHAFIRSYYQYGVTDKANDLRREGYDIGMVVVPDPMEALNLISSGFTTVVFTHSQYAIPSWRPDTGRGVRAWQDVMDETARLAKMKAQDARLRGDD